MNDVTLYNKVLTVLEEQPFLRIACFRYWVMLIVWLTVQSKK